MPTPPTDIAVAINESIQGLKRLVEDECARKDVLPPRWTEDRRRFVKPFWYLSENPALHQWELETAPAAFVRHGVLAAADELESV